MSIEVKLVSGTLPREVSCHTLRKLDGLYQYYHRQMWYYKEMYKKFKALNAFFNAVALVLVALGMIVGTLWPDSFAMVGLTAMSTTVKGWCDFKRFGHKMEMSRFAYTTYEKILVELETYARGLPLDDFEGFLQKAQINEETIKDLAPAIPDSSIKKYDGKFTFISLDTVTNDTRV